MAEAVIPCSLIVLVRYLYFSVVVCSVGAVRSVAVTVRESQSCVCLQFGASPVSVFVGG